MDSRLLLALLLVAVPRSWAQDAFSEEVESTLSELPRADEAVSDKVIYGVDGRMEVSALQDPRLGAVARASAALFRLEAVNVQGDVASLVLRPFTTAMDQWGGLRPLAESEPYRGQGAGAFCSGALIGPGVVLTARHCLQAVPCEGLRVVFGFAADAAGAAPRTLPASNVFNCAAVSHGSGRGADNDWALIWLDRAAAQQEEDGRRPATVELRADVRRGQRLFVIGYPEGLPAKYAGGAAVRDASHALSFIANLDTYAGNSGSPVFDAATRRIVGVLQGGEVDYVRQPDGTVASNVCPDAGCRGETVTRATLIAQALAAGPPRKLTKLAGR